MKEKDQWIKILQHPYIVHLPKTHPQLALYPAIVPQLLGMVLL